MYMHLSLYIYLHYVIHTIYSTWYIIWSNFLWIRWRCPLPFHFCGSDNLPFAWMELGGGQGCIFLLHQQLVIQNIAFCLRAGDDNHLIQLPSNSIEVAFPFIWVELGGGHFPSLSTKLKESNHLHRVRREVDQMIYHVDHKVCNIIYLYVYIYVNRERIWHIIYRITYIKCTIYVYTYTYIHTYITCHWHLS